MSTPESIIHDLIFLYVYRNIFVDLRHKEGIKSSRVRKLQVYLSLLQIRKFYRRRRSSFFQLHDSVLSGGKERQRVTLKSPLWDIILNYAQNCTS